MALGEGGALTLFEVSGADGDACGHAAEQERLERADATRVEQHQRRE